jgi:hypothetical protein
MSTDPAPRVRTAPLSPVERRHLWWAAPPLAVFALANVVFDLIGGGYTTVGRDLIGAAHGDEEPYRETVVVAAAMGWASLALVFVVVGAGVAVASWRILSTRVRGRARLPFVLFIVAVALGNLAHLFVVDHAETALRGIFSVTVNAVQAEPAVRAGEAMAARIVTAAINVMSGIVPAVFIAAAVATTLPPLAGWNEATLARRARQIRQIVALAAAFMVAGVLHMGAWTQLAGATLAVAADHAFDLAAVAVTLFWGAVFTLMIASFYLPMGMRLAELAEGVMDDLGVDVGERRQWLAARGLSFEPSQQLPQIAAVAAPLAAGPVSGVLSVAAERLTA